MEERDGGRMKGRGERGGLQIWINGGQEQQEKSNRRGARFSREPGRRSEPGLDMTPM